MALPVIPFLEPHWAYLLYYGVDNDNHSVARGIAGYACCEYFYTRVEAITYAVNHDILDYDLECVDIHS